MSGSLTWNSTHDSSTEPRNSENADRGLPGRSGRTVDYYGAPHVARTDHAPDTTRKVDQTMSKKKSSAHDKRWVHYDPKVDALYIAMKGGLESEVREVAPGVNVELNRKKEIIGIEILNAAQFFKSVLKPLEKRAEVAA